MRKYPFIFAIVITHHNVKLFESNLYFFTFLTQSACCFASKRHHVDADLLACSWHTRARHSLSAFSLKAPQ